MVPFAAGKDLYAGPAGFGQHCPVGQMIPAGLESRLIQRFRIMDDKRIRFIFIFHLLFPVRRFMLPDDNREEYSP